MSRDLFSVLDLTPQRYSTVDITRRFLKLRDEALARLDNPATYLQARRRLEELYQAYNVLRDPERQAEHLRELRDAPQKFDRVAYMRRLIAASLEGGLLRQSRREQLLAEGLRLGFSEFHTHLMIAQVQFDGRIVVEPLPQDQQRRRTSPQQVAARFAAAGVLALAMLLVMVRWLGA